MTRILADLKQSDWKLEEFYRILASQGMTLDDLVDATVALTKDPKREDKPTHTPTPEVREFLQQLCKSPQKLLIVERSFLRELLLLLGG